MLAFIWNPLPWTCFRIDFYSLVSHWCSAYGCFKNFLLLACWEIEQPCWFAFLILLITNIFWFLCPLVVDTVLTPHSYGISSFSYPINVLFFSYRIRPLCYKSQYFEASYLIFTDFGMRLLKILWSSWLICHLFIWCIICNISS